MRSNSWLPPGLVLIAGVGALMMVWRSPRTLVLCVAGFVVAVVFAMILERQSAQRDAQALARYIAASPSLEIDRPQVSRALAPAVVATTQASGDITRRLTDLQESRHQLEVLLEGMGDAVLGVDAAGRVQWSNARMQRLIHRDAPGSSVRHGRALVHTFRDPMLLESVQSTLDNGTASECRSEALLPGRIFQVNASPLPGGGAVVVLHDRTEAEHAERTQRDFVANVSHELRTPLTSIVGYVETVLDGEELSLQAQEFLATVLKNASRMQRLTEDLLLLTRVEQAESPIDPQPVPAIMLLHDALRTVSGASYAEGAHIEVEQATDRAVLADENAMLQVLGNLLENALKYSSGRADPARVLLSAREDPDTAGFVTFRVRDFGPGIASEHLTRIFERFYRVDKARSRATGGTGLGLSIARYLVEQHGGRMWAESNLGQGSTFVFTLPLAD
jgi:two-component system phosphate regulon sensor histidine kinase PhoR